MLKRTACALPNSTICCCYFCLINHPILHNRNWMLQKQKLMNTQTIESYKTKELMRTLNK